MNTNALKIRLFMALAVAAFSVISYYSKTSVNPITGEKQRISLSQDQEIAMGLQSAPQMAAEFGGEVADPQLRNYITAIGNKLVQNTDAARSGYPFQFHCLADEKTVNAFALPGGQIFITVGLLKSLEQGDEFEDQVAGVLGHEIGHVIGRHSAEHMAKQELTQGLIGAATMASGNMSGQQIAAMVGNMVNMKHGREDELESDRFGVHYMVQSGYKPASMIKVMEALARASGGKSQSEFQSSHPSPENRIAKIKEEIEKMGGGSNY